MLLHQALAMRKDLCVITAMMRVWKDIRLEKEQNSDQG